MEDILYKNSSTDVRTKEMVNKIDKFLNTNKQEYVNLGLPSGTLWATKNIGAKYEYEYGKYFAWGEVTGSDIEFQNGNYEIIGDKKFNTTGNDYVYGQYDDHDPNYGMIKYNHTDKKKVLERRDDVVQSTMGGGWHIPTPEQFEELFNTTYVNIESVQNYNNSGVNGILITSKVDNTKTLFLPYGGNCEDGQVIEVNESGDMWTNTLSNTTIYQAYSCTLYGNETSSSITSRTRGCTIRGVVG